MSLPVFPHFDYSENVHNVAQRWEKWTSKLETMFEAMDISDTKRQRALLKYYAGEETVDILSTLPNTGDNYSSAIEALNNYFDSQHNTSYEIFQFRKTEQLQNETLDQFVTKLKRLAVTCKFIDVDLEIRNQIILTGRSNKIRRFAIQHPNADTDDILKEGRAIEITNRHVAELEASTKQNINFLRKERKFDSKQRDTKHQHSTYRKPGLTSRPHSQKNKTCYFCGEDWHEKGLAFCKARGKTCNFCGKQNHLSKVCLSLSRNKDSKKGSNGLITPKEKATNVVVHEDTDSDDSSINYVSSALSIKSLTPKHEMVDLNINNNNFSFIIDTGASANVISKKDLDKLHKNISITETKTRLYAYGAKSPLELVGEVTLTSHFHKKTYSIPFIVTKEEGPALVGKSTALMLGIVNFMNNIKSVSDSTNSIVNRHPRLFQGLGKIKTAKVTLQMDEKIKPTVQKLRRIPFHLRSKVGVEIDELLKQDIIEPVPTNVPTTWISPIVPVPKKSEPSKVRICIDMKEANKAILREKCITPTLADVTYQLNGAQVFSKLDLNRGYHQLELDEASRHVTTFVSHKGLYRYKRLHFGVNTASDRFQHEIMKILASIPNALNISDDILVFGKTQEEHDETLETVLSKLESAGVTLNKDKCSFNRTSLKFLGNIFSNQGTSPDPDKIDFITKMHQPSNPKEVRSFLGTVNFCSKHIPHLAITAKPLRLLTKNNVKWDWKEEQQEAFNRIKQQITETTLLSYFDKNKSTEIWTDAGPEGLGAILIQRDENKTPHTLAFSSHALSETEKRYSQIEKEALAIIWATRYFHLYVHGSRFKIVTDHKPLLYLFNNSNLALSTRLERWKIKLMPYDYTLEYKPGKSNPADYLSRHPVDSGKSKISSSQIAERYINFVTRESTPKHLTIAEIQEATLLDNILTKVIDSLYSGNWNYDNLNNEEYNKFRVFKKVKHELATSAEKNILLKGAKLVIPTSLQKKIVETAHIGHQGISRTKDLLKEKVWFPGLNKMVEKEIESCILCRASSNDPQNYTPLLSAVPEGPWKELNIDHKGPLPSGEYLLVLIDKYSKFPIVEKVSSTAAKENIAKLDSIFSTFGLPNKITSDNGSPFNSLLFKQFMEENNISHHRIIPRWPKSNGQVERFNRVINKSIGIAMAGNEDWHHQLQLSLRAYRETPQKTTGRTPASLMLAYKSKSLIPDSSQLIHPTDDDEVRKKSNIMKEKCLENFNKKQTKAHIVPKTGDTVIVKQEKKSKLDQPFNIKPYTVQSTKGTMVTASSGKHSITRHESHFKVIPNKDNTTKFPVTANTQVSQPEIATCKKNQETKETFQNQHKKTQKETGNASPNVKEHKEKTTTVPANDIDNKAEPQIETKKYNFRLNRNKTKRLIEEI